jgi:alpha-tubulin suppressor-like RCC1 family protein
LLSLILRFTVPVVICVAGCGKDNNVGNDNNNNSNTTVGVCGDGVVDFWEQCDDGSANSDSLADACRTDCRTAYCGDGIADSLEACDGADLKNLQCSDAGHSGGQLACSDACNLIESGCSDCGDGISRAEEECDGDDLQSETCDTATNGEFPDGDLECSALCSLDSSVCHDCGNEAIEGPEICDGPALGSSDCTNEGFDGGVLSCDLNSDCLAFDTSKCTVCGDGACQFDLGEDRSTCWQDCDLWAEVAVGLHHTCATLRDGSVWCWGSNGEGQLGTGSFAQSSSPASVNLSEVTQISAGVSHSCAVDLSNQVWCWGNNAEGQLGDLSNTTSFVPVAVNGFNQATKVSCGVGFTCALKADGTVWCWGSNDRGQLGVAGLDSNTPVQVTVVSGAVNVSARSDRTACAALNNGDVYCWGGNDTYQLGRTTPTESVIPLQVPNLTVNIASVTLGGGGAGGGAYGVFACAIDGSSDLRCWGANNQGTLGINDSNTGAFPDPQLLSLFKASQIVGSLADSQAACAVRTSGQLACWGWNVRGELGDGTNTRRLAPLDVVGMTDVVSAGISFHACAVQGSGFLYCWGSYASGELGIGSIATPDDCFGHQCMKSPQPVSTPPPI